MDKRLVVELIPGPAFLLGNALGGIFAGAGLAVAATGVAIMLRWRWDRILPLMAISILVITLVLLAVGLVLDDTDYIKVSNTVGSIAFALMVAFGMLLNPSLLRRTLGYSITITDFGWRALHVAWIGISLARAALNEIVWRNTSDRTWAIYNGVSDIAWIGLFFIATSVIAHRFWDDTSSH